MLAHVSLHCDDFIFQERLAVLAWRDAESSGEFGLGSLVPITGGRLVPKKDYCSCVHFIS